MSFFGFISVFIILLAVGTVAIVGFYLSSRGDKDILPDGTEEKTGMIFKEWYFFWTKTKGKYRVYYGGNELEKLYKEYESLYSGNPFNFTIYGKNLIVPNTQLTLDYLRNNIEKLKVDLDVEAWYDKNGPADHMVAFYQEYDNYVFPEWIRKPLAECPTCMSSVYGSLIYWPIMFLTGGYLFGWTKYPVFASIFFWAIYCLSLATLNTIVAKKARS